ncbi:methyltransferase family protein [Enterobacter sp. BIGb0383]|uniref:class I SAM-dependent methyltransferase n=1 Tax=unclassified Enterobacter TaxID=2608935 RepID=UPI000F48FA5B|nr:MULTISPECIES: class I SAM-dependent methyltransferase [unclassified Enterobacter]ROP59584.1 methyltransferase family protein [Enterobacter sp. BIGb0383]ROS08948.1 methyltransferase family protein [Enterobacter sp. BIGb0359]
MENFLEPDQLLQSLSFTEIGERLNVKIKSGNQPDLTPYAGRNIIFDDIILKRNLTDNHYEDQCTAKYYFDIFNTIKATLGEATRIVEVGVFMGGSTSILAGCAHYLGMELDLIDICPNFLQFARERARRSYPDAVESRVRMFHGSLPEYVRDVLKKEDNIKVIIHHDGSHSFEQVIRDLGSLYYIRNNVHSLLIQDTNLRGMPKYFNFVDSAVFSIFGRDVNYAPLGSVYQSTVGPNQWEGNYVMPGEPEGMYIPLSHNKFHYPHPRITLGDFFEET